MMKEILPIVLDSSFKRLAVIDDYISFIWTTRYYTCGDFELCVDVNDKTIGLFKKDYFIVRDDDENVGVIERIEIDRNEDGQEILIVSGRFLSSIIERRIISKQTILNGSISDCINTLLNNEVIEPVIGYRTIPDFILGEYNIAQTMKAQYTGKNLLETISDICKLYGIGFNVALKKVNYVNKFVFNLFEGEDRTYDQDVNTYVVFSDEYDNLLSSEYVEDYQQIVTDVLVAGEGEGADRKTLWVSNGINLNDASYWQKGGLNNGQNVDNDVALRQRMRTKTGFNVKPNTTYVITKKSGTAIGIQQMTAEGGEFLYDSTWQTGTTYRFTTEPDCTFIRICLRLEPSADISTEDVANLIDILFVENNSGLNRYELYKDQRNLQSNDGEISEADYQAQMRESGLESITKITTAFTGTVYFGNIEWKQDVNIGDICVIENKRWGIYINSRLIEVIESVSESGEYSIVPSFGI